MSGYNLDDLLPERFNVARALVGTEGTCVTVLEAKVKLIPSPQHRVLVGIGYKDAFIAADHVPEILSFEPIGFEGFEGSIVDGLRLKGAPKLDLLPDGRGIVLVEFGSDDPEHARSLGQQLIDRLRQVPDAPNTRLYTPAEARHVWFLRESGPRAAAFAPGAAPQWEGWDDAAVAPEKLGRYLRDIRALMDEYGYVGAFYGHFGHGCIHMRVSFDLESEAGIRKYGEFVERAADLVVSYGGSLSGEHGDGQSRGSLLPKMFGPELVDAFRQFKSVFDPQNRMNPHKVVDAYLPTENLRLGADYKPLEPATHFKFVDDHGSFAGAAARCIGLGACRKVDSGAMCPSYMVTLEEEHTIVAIAGGAMAGVCGRRQPRGVIAISVPVMVAIRVSTPSFSANARASHTVSVRPGLTTPARNANRSPFAGASRLVLNSTVRTSEPEGISVKAAMPQAVSNAAVMMPAWTKPFCWLHSDA